MKRKVIGILRRLESQHGTLRPIDVVEAAKSKRSPLHDHFTWDDTQAAHERRLDQARALIREVKITVLTQPNREPVQVRAFVSLPEDRVHGLGYRSIPRLLSNEDFRRILLDESYRRLEEFRNRYGALKELRTIIKSIDKLLNKQGR